MFLLAAHGLAPARRKAIGPEETYRFVYLGSGTRTSGYSRRRQWRLWTFLLNPAALQSLLDTTGKADCMRDERQMEPARTVLRPPAPACAVPGPAPRDSAFDSTLAFFREGYGFVGRRCRRLESDLFRTRILLRPVLCMMGEEAARRFYDGASFTRVGAMPQTTLRLLQDKGSVQMLDGAAHAARKRLFLDLASDGEAARIGALFERQWHRMLPLWRRRGSIVFHEAMVEMLTIVACDWAGVPPAASRRPRLAQALAAMVNGAGSAGPRNWRAQLRRRWAERWARQRIREVRSGAIELPPQAPLARLVAFEDGDGSTLETSVAAVELLNLLRPIVAVARFLTFAALALHQHPAWRARLLNDAEGRWSHAFAQEVRRFYPFFPVIGGRARAAFTFCGHDFVPGDWVLFGLHATNHDPRLWPEPDSFRPERFLGWRSNGFDLVPQGAGDMRRDHRCPGEAITLALLRQATLQLAGLDHRVPRQNLKVPLNRFPTLPRSGMVMRFD